MLLFVAYPRISIETETRSAWISESMITAPSEYNGSSWNIRIHTVTCSHSFSFRRFGTSKFFVPNRIFNYDYRYLYNVLAQHPYRYFVRHEVWHVKLRMYRRLSNTSFNDIVLFLKTVSRCQTRHSSFVSTTTVILWICDVFNIRREEVQIAEKNRLCAIKQASASSHRPPTTNHQPSTTNHQAASGH